MKHVLLNDVQVQSKAEIEHHYFNMQSVCSCAFEALETVDVGVYCTRLQRGCTAYAPPGMCARHMRPGYVRPSHVRPRASGENDSLHMFIVVILLFRRISVAKAFRDESKEEGSDTTTFDGDTRGLRNIGASGL